jgi:hypothetical protein
MKKFLAGALACLMLTIGLQHVGVSSPQSNARDHVAVPQTEPGTEGGGTYQGPGLCSNRCAKSG